MQADFAEAVWCPAAQLPNSETDASMRRDVLQTRIVAYGSTIVGVAAVTAVCAPFAGQLGNTTVALALLLVVLAVASVWGSWPGLVASVLAALSFNFFFLPPLYSFTIAEPQDWVALAAFLVTAVTAGHLSERAKRRAAAAGAARAASAYSRSLIEANLDPLVTIGADGRIIDVNSATEAVTGRPRAELIGTDFSGYFTEPERARDGSRQAWRAGFVRDLDLKIRHCDGQVTSVLYNASVYRDDAGQAIGVVVAVHPIHTSAGLPARTLLDPDVVRGLRRFISFTSLLSVAVGLLGLAGWMFRIPALKSVIPGQVVIKPNAAVCLVLIGLSLWLVREVDDRPLGKARKLGGQLLAVLTAAAGLLSLTEHIGGWDLGIDQLLFQETAADAIGSLRPGLMAPITALDFLLLGLATLLLDWTISWRSHRYSLSQVLAGVAAIASIVGLLDFVLGSAISYTHIALQTAVTLCLLSLSVVCARTEWGVAALFASSSFGGALIRWLLPAAIFIPMLIGTLWWKAFSAGLSSAWTGGTLMIVSMIVLLGSLTMFVGFLVDRADVEHKKTEQALHRREEELREAQRLARVGSWWWDPRSDKVTWSDELGRIVGRDPKLAPAGYDDLSGFFTAESFSRLNAAVQEALRTGTPYELELELVTADGSQRSVTARGEVERHADGQIVLVRGTMHDITERKQVEEGLQRSAEEIRDLYNHAPCGYHSLDKEGVFVKINDTELQWLGYAREDLIDKVKFSELLAPTSRSAFAAEFPRLKAEGSVRDIEFDLVRKDGTILPVLLSATAIYDPTGNYLMSRSMVYDMTELKQAEEALRESEANLNRAQEIAHLGSWYLDIAGGRITGSDELFRVFGVPKGAARTIEALRDLVYPEDREAVDRAWAGALRGTPYSIEHRIVVGGEPKWVRERARVEFDVDGRAARGIGTVQDISERKRAEDKIRQLARLEAEAAELGQDALRGTPLPEVLDGAVTRVARALGVDFCNVAELLPGGDEFLLRAGVGWKDGIVGRATVKKSGSQPGYTILSDRPVTVENVATETRFALLPRLFGEEVVSSMSVVIATTEGPYGTLGAHCRRPRVFTPDEVNFVQAVANVLGMAIERRRAEDRLRRVNRAHRALSSCNQALVRATDESALLQRICQIIIEEAGYRFCWVGYAEQDAAKAVRPVAQAGFDEGYLKASNITWSDSERGRGPTGTCIRTGQIQIAKNFATDPKLAPWRAEALKRGYASSVALPLKDATGIFGALTIYAGDLDAFDPDELKLFVELAADLAYGIVASRAGSERATAVRRFYESLEDTVGAIASTIEMRDPYTAGHQRRVAKLAALIAGEMGLPEPQTRGIFLAGLIHDVGKINVPAEILSKPGKLTPLELEFIRTHAQAGYDIIKGVEFPWPIAETVLQHHERLDGSGYPRGLAGEAVIVEARILAVADVTEAIMAHRPYRPALGLDAALAEIESGKGRLYHPAAVDACITLFRNKGFTFQ